MESPVDFFESSQWTAGVIGLGYVGLPLLLSAVDSGLEAIGFDISESTVRGLLEARSSIDDVSSESLEAALAHGTEFTSDAARLADADVIFICVPTPLGRNREPDLSYIERAAATVAEIARPGQLIALESTTYPGTTEELIVGAIEKAGLELDQDVWVVYSPERVSPGDNPDTAEIPKVVGGVTADSGAVGAAAYSRLVPSVHLVSSARVAEMTKLVENTYRAVNIGLINEVAQLSHLLDIDVWEVVDAAATKPFGFQPFYPGPGVGGHCIPLDPQYLAWKARGANFATRFIETAEQVNSHMPEYVVSRAGELLNRDSRALRDSRVLVVGLAYKRDISDDRESAALEVAKLLRAAGADLTVIDPYVGDERIADLGFGSVAGITDGDQYDLALVLTDHSDFAYEAIARAATRVFDARGVYRRLGLTSPNVEAL